MSRLSTYRTDLRRHADSFALDCGFPDTPRWQAAGRVLYAVRFVLPFLMLAGLVVESPAYSQSVSDQTIGNAAKSFRTWVNTMSEIMAAIFFVGAGIGKGTGMFQAKTPLAGGLLCLFADAMFYFARKLAKTGQTSNLDSDLGN